MAKLLALVIVIGIAIGLAAPGAPPTPVQNAAPEEAATNAPQPPRPPTGWGAETRLRADPSGHFRTPVLVNGQSVEMVVDTGASTIALTEADAARIGIAVEPGGYDVVGSGAGGPVRGQRVTLDRVSVGGREVRGLSGAVIEGLGVSLLGQNYLSQTGVEISGGELVLR